VFSYCLSMIDPGWQQALDAALCDLQPGGLLAVVDFHDTRFSGLPALDGRSTMSGWTAICCRT
jgi:hypothetical protein